MSDERKRKREHPIPFRPPKELRHKLIMDAKRANMSLNGYLTFLCQDKPSPRQVRTIPIEKKLLGKMLVELANIKSVLIQIRDTQAQNKNELLKHCHDELILIRNAIFKALWRKP